MKTRRRRRKQRPRTRRLQFSQLGYEPLEDRCLLADTGLTGGGMPHENVQPSLPLNYIIATQGIFPSENGPVGAPDGTFNSIDPYLGEVQLFAGTFAPQGWTFADGQILQISQHQALFSILGTTYGGDGETTFALPDLRGRVPVGVGDPDGSGPIQPITLGQKGGLEEVTLDETELPSHNHTVTGGNTDPTGGGQGHENRQPFLGLHYIIREAAGIFPTPSQPGEGVGYGESQIDVGFEAIDDFLGEIRLFAGNFAPQNWALANGQVRSISSNSALFSLLGTTYGGDGETTFGLPDLRARTAIHAGTGPGLSARSLGAKVGEDFVTLTENEIPSHTHTTTGDPTGATGGGQSHGNMMPSLAVNYIINVFGGVFPSGPSGGEEAGSFLGSNPFLAEVSMFAGTFAPSGWELTDGQLLNIPQNTALFSLIGTIYGGDGETTVGLPDLRGRAAMHGGQGPGLTNRLLGQAGATGVETVTLTVAEMPSHKHTFTPADTVPPTATSIARQVPMASPTNADSVTFRVTFSEDVQNVDAADFALSGTASGDGTVGAPSAVTGTSVYDVTITGLTNSNGTVNLDFAGGQNIQDLAGNALANTTPGSEEDYTLDNTAPTLTAFARNNPATSPTNADTLVFDITFDGSVNNVDAGDFDITGTTASGVLGGSGASYTLTLSGGDLAGLNGTVGLNLAAGQNIADAAGNPLGAGEPGTDETYTLDNTAPMVTAIDRADADPTSAASVDFTVTFSEAVNDIETGDFALATTGSVTANIASVSAATGTTVTVTVDTIAGSGTLGLNFDFDATDSVTDAAGNAAAADFTGQTYTVQPASAGSLADDDPPIFSAGGFTYLASATNPHGYAGPDGVQDNYYSAANSGNMATWTFSVTPGVYRISANWVDHMNRATNSPFSVFDGPAGGTPVDSTTVNQRVAPDDFEDDGVFWEDIFERVPISGSTLTVKLSDTPANGYVIADGMRIELIDEPEIALADLGNAEADIVAASTVDLGRAIIDSTVTRQFRIENLGGVDLNVSNVSISNTMGSAFSFSPDPNPVGAVAALDSSNFTIGLDTSALGTFQATVTVTSDDDDEGTFSFNLSAEVSPSKIIDNGDFGGFHAPSFSGLGTGYVGAPQGYQDDVHYHVPQTAGAAHANWVFTGLAPGTYQVSATWNEHSNRANNSPFSVVGTTTDGSVPVNQRAAPGTFSGAVTDDGSDFAPLIIGGNGGNFELSGSTLTVKLSTSSSGYVIADAVRIEKLPELRAEEAVVRGRESVAGGQRSVASRGLSLSDVDTAFDAAVAHWTAIDASATARLSKVTVQVANLPGQVLGLASESQSRIWLDANAAGHGWAMSQETRAKGRGPNDVSLLTPSPSHPLTPSSFDLLTVVTHELGHVLGLPDLDPMHRPHDVMSGRLAAGQRRIAALNLDRLSGLPPADLVAVDRLFDRWDTFEASQPADSIRWQPNDSWRPTIEPASLVGRVVKGNDDDDAFSFYRDDRADGIAADAAFEESLAGVE